MKLADLYSRLPHVLLVHASDGERSRLEETFLARRRSVASFESGAGALGALRDGEADAVVIGEALHGEALRTCERIARRWPQIPTVVLGGPRGPEPLSAMRAGAFDWVPDPTDAGAADHVVTRALLWSGLRRVLHQRVSAASPDDPLGALVGASPAMQQVRTWVRTIAASGGTVIITGETGTGKELAARTLHRGGPRRDGPFVAINCAAIPSELMESMLFGHARGAFTDARQARRGLLQQAHGGTLLLDEIPHLPLALQAKLLRALETRTVRAVGSDRESSFDVRVLVATNRSLEGEVEAGRFRRDLYYRLAVFELPLPPLRRRGADVLLLARHFLERAADRMGKGVRGLTPAAASRLMDHAWPGNVRELQNCMEGAVALARSDHICEGDLPRVFGDVESAATLEPFDVFPLAALEDTYLGYVTRRVEGNKTEAARILGIDRKTLLRRQLAHHPPDERALRWIVRNERRWRKERPPLQPSAARRSFR